MSIVHSKLSLWFDPKRLRAEVSAIDPAEWHSHYNESDYEGHWTGVALRAVAGSRNPLYADCSPGAQFANTAVLERSPYLRSVLAAFECPLRSARLLRLGPGARIKEHRDPHLGLEDGEARIHIPIATNPGVEFVLDGRRLVMNEGETWYLDLSQPHRVKNLGETARIHLVIDCEVNGWLREIIESGTIVPSESPTQAATEQKGGLAEFRQRVVHDAELQAQLRETTDSALFIKLVERLGREHGYEFCAADVEDALRASRRAWIERGIH